MGVLSLTLVFKDIVKSLIFSCLLDANEPEKSYSPLLKFFILPKCAEMQNLWSAWRSEGQSFWVGVELDLWWIEPSASEGTGIFTRRMSCLCMVLDVNLKQKIFFFAYLYRFQMNCWSRPKLLLRQLLRRWMLTKKQDDLPRLGVFGAVEISDPFGVTHWTWPICHNLLFWPMSCETPLVEVWYLDWFVPELWFTQTGFWSTGLCVFFSELCIWLLAVRWLCFSFFR